MQLVVPGGWKEQGNPGRGRGGVRTAGGVGGFPDMAACSTGLSQGKLQAKFDGSFLGFVRIEVTLDLIMLECEKLHTYLSIEHRYQLLFRG